MGKKPKGNFKGHIYPLCLNRKLYLQTIRLQADMRLGKAYSALLPFVEGLHVMGYLDDATYEVYKNKYSVGLEDAANAPTPAQIKKQETRHNKNRQLNRHFGEVLAQWSQLKPKSQEYHLKEAAKYRNLKNARLLLDLAKPNTPEAL